MTNNTPAPAGLLPCPFCGGKAKLVEGEECAYVQCLDAKYHRGPFVSGDNNASEEAAAAWNSRAAAITPQPDDLCPRCEGATIYISRDVVTGQEVEISCLYCNETGRISPAQTTAQPNPQNAEIERLREVLELVSDARMRRPDGTIADAG